MADFARWLDEPEPQTTEEYFSLANAQKARAEECKREGWIPAFKSYRHLAARNIINGRRILRRAA